MTGRTLEEIEALAADATPGPWWINPEFRADVHCQHGCIAEVIDFDAVHPDSFASEQQQLANAELIAALPDILAIAQGQRERLAALDNAPRWSRHSERCGVAAALGVTTDRVDLDSVVYAVVKKLMDMRGGAAILSIELQEWMGKWPHQAASRR